MCCGGCSAMPYLSGLEADIAVSAETCGAGLISPDSCPQCGPNTGVLYLKTGPPSVSLLVLSLLRGRLWQKAFADLQPPCQLGTADQGWSLSACAPHCSTAWHSVPSCTAH